jgi:O-antigen/teichoic acid export membrane protein
VVLNATAGMERELQILAIVVFSFFSLRLILQLFNIILIADQKPAKSSLFNLLANLSSLIIIFVLTKLTKGSLFKVGMVISGMPVLVLFVASLWFYNKDYKVFAPHIKYVKFKFAKDLMGLGVKFFIIQIAAVVLYQTSNIVIAQLFGPAKVTNYYVAFKYFSVVTMAFGIILTPFWSAFTEANAIGDIQWIKSIMKKLQWLWFAMIGVVVIMLLASGFIFNLWVGDKVNISFSLSAVIALYVIINTWNGIYSHFLNGVGKIKLQLYSGIWGILINIPLAIYLGRIIGIEGVVLSTCLLGMVNMVWSRMQYVKLINNTATGIWAK